MRGGWVYILTNKPNGILYTGYGVKRLVWCEHHDTITGAIQRERNMKTLAARV